MSESAVLVRWGAPYVGREEMSFNIFMSVVQYYHGLKEKGEIEDIRIYIDEVGNLTQQGGTMVIEGTTEQINKVRESEEYITQVMKANHAIRDLTVQTTYSGDKVMQRMERLQVIRKELGI